MLEARRLDGFFGYVDLLLVCRRLESARRVNGGFVDADFFAVGWLEARWVNSCLVDTNFLTVAWLELGSVLTLCNVNLGLVVTTAWTINFYLDFVVVTEEMRAVEVWELNVKIVFSAVMRSVDIEMSFCVSVMIGSVTKQVSLVQNKKYRSRLTGQQS